MSPIKYLGKLDNILNFKFMEDNFNHLKDSNYFKISIY